MRQFILLAVGLGVGIAGTMLFSQSLPPAPGSVEERAEKAEVELRKAEKKIAAFEAVMGTNPGGRFRDTFTDRTRRIAEDIRAGRPVSVDDVFNATKPVIRDLAPLFERMRLHEQKAHFDRLAGEFSRNYEMTQDQEEALSELLEQRAQENAANYFEVLTDDSTRFVDFVRASEDFERDAEIDDFMEQTLTGEKREQFKSDRLNERLTEVQNEADRNVRRLDTIVELDEDQKDQMFVFMARSSRDFDPTMQFEGLTGDTGRLKPGQDRNSAILSVLRPDQRAAFEEHRRTQRANTERGLRDVGLTMPEDWDLFDEWN